jgi:hypothetical protein
VTHSDDSRASSPRCPWFGLLTAASLLLVAELFLHTDAFLYRYRSVFAAGRALDKVQYVESNRPELLILGNSRADNGFDPVTLQRMLGFRLERAAFNLALPGADARVLDGIVERLDQAGSLGTGGARYAVVSLDEALVQPIDTIGQDIFFASTSGMWADGRYHDLLRASLHLYGYASNLRELREPGSLARFARATFHDVDPVGGAAAAHLGYRAGFGGLQDVQSARLQEVGSLGPPDAVNVEHLWRILDLLQRRGVRVAVVFPPLLNRDVLYLAGPPLARAPYLLIVDELSRRRVPMVALDAGPPRDPAEFSNAGHLNDRGAQRYSKLLGQALSRIWAVESGDGVGARPQAKAQ